MIAYHLYGSVCYVVSIRAPRSFFTVDVMFLALEVGSGLGWFRCDRFRGAGVGVFMAGWDLASKMLVGDVVCSSFRWLFLVKSA